MTPMLGSKTYYIYILTNKSGTLYTGITGNLKRRVWQHKTEEVKGFTQKYNIDKLIYSTTRPSARCGRPSRGRSRSRAGCADGNWNSSLRRIPNGMT